MTKRVLTSSSSSLQRWQSIPHHRTEETPSVSRDLVASVLPEQMLHEDEVVLILTKPSLWFILITSFRFILTFVLLGVLAVQVTPYASFSPQTIALATVIICMGRLVWALAVWTSHTYMLTNQRIVTIKGVVNIRVFQAHLRKIQRTTLFKPLILRLFGIGTVGFATAATTDFDSTWVMIARPVETHESIVAAIRKAQ
ncbi:MAG: PH domain-containing protein [Phycisphaerae bacterium]